jgi:hypothetical protein
VQSHENQHAGLSKRRSSIAGSCACMSMLLSTMLECAAVSRLCWLQADIVSIITFVDGAGTIRRVVRNSRVGRGLAGGLGMLGVITEITLQLTPGLGRMRSWSPGARSDANMAQELLQLWVGAAGLDCTSCSGCWAEQAARPTAASLHACVIALQP